MTAAIIALTVLLGVTIPHSAQALRLVKKIAVGGWPKGLAVSPDGERTYVGLVLDESIAVIERKTLKVVARFGVGGRPEGLVLSPDAKRLYVSLADRGRVEARNTETGVLEASIPVPPRPRGLALDATGRYLYVACARASALAIVDTTHGRVVGELELGWSPRAIAFVPKTGHLVVVNAVGHSLYVIDPAIPKVLHRIKGFGRRPLDIAITRDGQTAFVPASKKDAVYRVDLAAGRITSSQTVGSNPVAVALSASERSLYVALWDEGRIALWPTGGGRSRKVKTGKTPVTLKLSPSGKTLYAACLRAHEVWVYSTQ